MNVLLINSVTNLRAENHNIGLLSIGSYLEHNGHKVYIHDMNTNHDLRLITKGFKPDVVGISAFTPFADIGYNLGNYFKQQKIFTVIGGAHTTALPYESLEHANVAVVGEGEETMLDLLTSRRNGIIDGVRLDPLDKVRYNYDLINFEHYSNIRKGVFNSMWAFVLPMDKVMATAASRGCPWRCIYCHNTYTNIKARFRQPDLIVAELKELKKRGIDAFALVDDDFLIHKKWAEEVCNKIADAKLGMYFSVNVRANDITEDALLFLRKAGCLQVCFGFESANDRILKILEKGTTVEMNKNAIDLCNKHDFIVQGSFMYGNPTETWEEMNNTFKFMNENQMDGGLGSFITTPMPSTKLWDWCVNNGKIIGKPDWSQFFFNQIPVEISEVPRDKFQNFMAMVTQSNENLFASRENVRFDKARRIKEELGV